MAKVAVALETCIRLSGLDSVEKFKNKTDYIDRNRCMQYQNVYIKQHAATFNHPQQHP